MHRRQQLLVRQRDIQFISKYGWNLDSPRFGAMQMADDYPSIYNLRFKKYHNTVVGVSTRLCCNFSGRNASVLQSVLESIN